MPKSNKYRRITSQDNSTTLPQRVTFPQGTFISNPSTAAAGSLGGPFGNAPATGGINPRVQFGANSDQAYNANAFLKNIPARLHNAVQSFDTPTPLTPYRTPGGTESALQQWRPGEKNYITAQPVTGFGPAYQARPQQQMQQSAMNQYRQGEKGNVFDENNPILNSVIGRIANGEAADLTKQDQAALEKFLLKNSGQGGGETTPGTPAAELGEGDFYGYERDPETGKSVRVVKNSATDNFRDELRWDPKRKKYIKVGKYMNEQKKLHMKKRYGGPGLAKKGGGSGGGAAPQQAAPEERNMGGGYGLVSFNTGLG
jgi:hypothetical protein